MKNGAITKKIIASLDVQPNETIIEIGPGHGELTLLLAATCEKIGADIVAVEKDKKLADELEIKIGGNGGVKIINTDILEFFKKASHEPFITGKFKVVGNIPYYISGHLFRVLGELKTKPDLAIIMIQKEVAERIAATPPRMNRLAASVQFWAEATITANVPRSDFSPPPEVDSAVIKLITKNSAGSALEAERYYAVVRALFAQPRKTILNNLAATERTLDSSSSTDSVKNGIVKMLTGLDIDPKSRPQDLTVEKILQVAQNF